MLPFSARSVPRSYTCSPPSDFVFSSFSFSFLLFNFLGFFFFFLSCSALCNVADSKHKSLGDPFAWSREGSRSWGLFFEFPVLASARPTTTDLRLGFFFLVFFWFWSCDTSPTAPAQSLHQARVQTRQPRCRFPPRYTRSSVERRGNWKEERKKKGKKKRRGWKGKGKKKEEKKKN